MGEDPFDGTAAVRTIPFAAKCTQNSFQNPLKTHHPTAETLYQQA
jgi:hypothetical protein